MESPPLILSDGLPDRLYRTVPVTALEKFVIDSAVFRRLARIGQYGLAPTVFPALLQTTRYEHCIGAAHLAGVAGEALWRHHPGFCSRRALQCLRLAALVHDLGHGPLSHWFDHCLLATLDHPDKATTLVPYRHEARGVALLRALYARHADVMDQLGQRCGGVHFPEDLNLIERMVRAEALPAPAASELPEGFCPALFLLISNPSFAIDVDRLDYVLRDMASADHILPAWNVLTPDGVVAALRRIRFDLGGPRGGDHDSPASPATWQPCASDAPLFFAVMKRRHYHLRSLFGHPAVVATDHAARTLFQEAIAAYRSQSLDWSTLGAFCQVQDVLEPQRLAGCVDGDVWCLLQWYVRQAGDEQVDHRWDALLRGVVRPRAVIRVARRLPGPGKPTEGHGDDTQGPAASGPVVQRELPTIATPTWLTALVPWHGARDTKMESSMLSQMRRQERDTKCASKPVYVYYL